MWRTAAVILLLASLVVAKKNLRSDADGLNPYCCELRDVIGQWIFDVGEGGGDKSIECLSTGTIARQYQMALSLPNVVNDEFGNEGFWTLIDGAGIEVVVHGRKYFAFLKFNIPSKGEAYRYCNETFSGSSHNVLGEDWACFFGHKPGTSNSQREKIDEVLEREERSAKQTASRRKSKSRLYRTEPDMVDAINSAQSSWTATHYKEYDSMTVEAIQRRAGSRLRRINRNLTPAPITKEQEGEVADLPATFDWRNVQGANYVSPVRDQGGCGSCYAFASAAMNEARLSIASHTMIDVVFSVQDVVDCASVYSFGCDGGSAYTIAGKYAEDYGMVEESCNTYAGTEGLSCATNPSCKRYYFTGYEYVGGYYGACNEAQMRIDLVKYGPLAVAIQVEEDFMTYMSGIYHPTGITSRDNDFIQTDHEVTLVGYGTDPEKGEYWIIKNSWGVDWGEEGYIRMGRGSNVCGVEMEAMQSFPIF